MGGFNSGRRRRFTTCTVQETGAINFASILRNAAQHDQGISFGWLQDTNGEVFNFFVNLPLGYTDLDIPDSNMGRPVTQRLTLDSTPVPSGRRRWWVCCPVPDCGRRCLKLYRTGPPYEPFRCRLCSRLIYMRIEEYFRLYRKIRKIRRRLGDAGNLLDPLPPRKKFMHRETYRKLQKEFRAATEPFLELQRIRVKSIRSWAQGLGIRKSYITTKTL